MARCDHKFIDSRVCLKCGWNPEVPASDWADVDAAYIGDKLMCGPPPPPDLTFIAASLRAAATRGYELAKMTVCHAPCGGCSGCENAAAARLKS